MATAATTRIALAGNPNCGKSTLFNALTGAHAQVTNAPGTTVELQTGTWQTEAGSIEVVDLPGTYSLLARSPDERVTADYLIGATSRPAPDRPDLVVVVLDATALARSLYLLAQVRDTGLPLVAAVTMLDVAATRGVEPDLSALADAAQVEVVALDPRTGTGVEGLAVAIDRELTAGRGATVGRDPAEPANLSQLPWDDSAERNFAWTERVLAAAVPAPPQVPLRSLSDRLDKVLLHPVSGIVVFAAVLWALFELVTLVATPMVDGVQRLIQGPLADLVRAAIPDRLGWLQSLVVDGVLTGVGTVLSFTPLLALVFLAIGLLEDSGYLARAAFVADRAMRSLGLDGRAMVPLVVGFGCNVPAIAATRTMPDQRRRLLTGLLIPLTSCPARLTVYVLIAGVFFPRQAGTVIFGMYMLSGVLVVLGGLALRATLFRDLATTRPLVLALPAYHVPRLQFLGRTTGQRIWSFIKGAGGLIAGTLVVVWLLTAIPVPGARAEAGPQSGFASVAMADSVFGRAAGAVAPVLAPAGLDDWRIASSLATGFVAKEVMVGSLAQTLSDGPAVDASQSGLADRLQQVFSDASGGHPRAAAAAFLVLVLAYTPCIATVAEQRRVFGLRWALGAMVVQLVGAWALAVLTFQLLRVVL